jgi:hypothetical protein
MMNIILDFKGRYFELNDINQKYIIEDPSGLCTGQGALLVVQVACSQHEAYLLDKNHIALVLVCIGLFAVMSYYAGISFMLQFSHVEKLRWDMETRTAGDYTIELNIEKE